MIRLSPYFNFKGQTREAMKFYQSIFGGEIKSQTYAESKQAKKEEENDLVMHAVLNSPDLELQVSDVNEEHPVTEGNNMHLCLSGDDEENLTKYFNGLCEGGHVDTPLIKEFWGDTFGMVTDKF